jgi:choloylglycine hydrolase
LHWLIADANASLVAEPLERGLTLYDDPWGVLTNAPSFPHHVSRLADYMQLSPSDPHNRLCPEIPMQVYANGLGAMGLPGDFSSASRFVRAVFASGNTRREDTKKGSINRFFHVMDTVSVPNGCILRGDGKPIRTVYTSCMDAQRMRYYYTTYDSRGIRCVAPAQAALDGERPVRYNRVSCEGEK